jgi:hypothetical protein
VRLIVAEGKRRPAGREFERMIGQFLPKPVSKADLRKFVDRNLDMDSPGAMRFRIDSPTRLGHFVRSGFSADPVPAGV